MPLWDAIANSINSSRNEKTIIEISVIAEAIKGIAKQEYCFLSSPLEAAIRSEGIALVTATLIKETGNVGNLNRTLEKGAQIYDLQFGNQINTGSLQNQE